MIKLLAYPEMDCSSKTRGTTSETRSKGAHRAWETDSRPQASFPLHMTSLPEEWERGTEDDIQTRDAQPLGCHIVSVYVPSCCHLGLPGRLQLSPVLSSLTALVAQGQARRVTGEKPVDSYLMNGLPSDCDWN